MPRATEKIAEVRPYVERAVRDEEVRDNVLAAVGVAREVYNELLGNRGVATIATRVATDKDIQDRLRAAVDDLRVAAEHVQGKKQEDHSTRNLLLLLTGVILGLLFNPVTGPPTREWLKSKVLGPSDDFTYSGDTSGNSTPTAA